MMERATSTFISDDWAVIRSRIVGELTANQIRMLEIYFLAGAGTALRQLTMAGQAGFPVEQAMAMLQAEHSARSAVLAATGTPKAQSK